MEPLLPQHHRLLFYGRGSRYFGIWAVNVILTVLTLGLYYPWAKAAVRKYIWNETELDGDRFVYHGTGKEMFKGFIIAYGAIVLLLTVAFFSPLGFLFLYLGIFFLTPVAIFGAWRYRLSRTSWRGIFFSFRGNRADFIKLYLTQLFFTIITFGIYMPWMRVKVMKYLFGHSQIGQYKLDFKGDGGHLFGINIGGILLTIFTFYIYLPWYITNLFNFTIDNTEIRHEEEVSRLKSTMKGGSTFWVLVSNAFLVSFTFGIGFPWAIIRRYELYIESINIPMRIDLTALTQDADNYKNAAGDDLADILDIELDF